ncbi:MAG: hypothetical protein HY331_02660 [Chloroflexi bacterium]|nr:hypothetical protein [Chloroflexota bacterium]
MSRERVQRSAVVRYLADALPTLTDGSRSYTSLQLLFLGRLAELVWLRHEALASQPVNDLRVALVNRALFSTYLDCIRLDAADEARHLIAGKGIKRTPSPAANPAS